MSSPHPRPPYNRRVLLPDGAAGCALTRLEGAVSASLTQVAAGREVARSRNPKSLDARGPRTEGTTDPSPLGARARAEAEKCGDVVS
jgi:hypothetical protein